MCALRCAASSRFKNGGSGRSVVVVVACGIGVRRSGAPKSERMASVLVVAAVVSERCVRAVCTFTQTHTHNRLSQTLDGLVDFFDYKR